MSLGEAATYPTESNDWMMTVIFGTVLLGLSVPLLLIVPIVWHLVGELASALVGADVLSLVVNAIVIVGLLFFLVPLLPVYGYLVRVMGTTIVGDEVPPSFEDWTGLFADGLKAFVVVFVYQFVPLIVFAVTVGGSLTALASNGGSAGLADVLTALAVSTVVAVVFGYVGVAGLVNFAREVQSIRTSFGSATTREAESIRAGFEFDTILEVVTDPRYLTAWGYVVALGLAVFAILAVISFVPHLNILNLLLGPIAAFYLSVVFARLWAQGYVGALDLQA